MKTSRVTRISLVRGLFAAPALLPLPLDERFEFREKIGEREARIVLYAPDEESAREAAAEGFGSIRQLEETRALDAATSAAERLTRTVARLEELGVDVGFPTIQTGLACDLALETLAGAGLERVLVELGGVTVIGAAPPDANGWSVSAGSGAEGYEPELLVLANAALSRAVGPDDIGATVLTTDGATADALVTTVHLRGRHEGRALVSRWGGARLFLEDPRFASLFDGETLEGWTTTGGPYDGAAAWSVEDGAITGRTGPNGEGGLLYTVGEYTSFAFELETRIDEPFDSGIFVRMLPGLKGAQVTLDYRPDGEVGAIYSEGFLAHNTDAKAMLKPKRWNHVEVRCTGFDMRLEVWLNGELVTDFALSPDSRGYAPSGLIGLQVHGGAPSERRVQFRNVRIRELPVFGEESRQREGWTPLFNGKDLSGWEITGHKEGYRVQDGVLMFPTKGSGHIQTVEDYRDFRLQLDFKLARMANSGVFLRAAREESDPTYPGCEIQILDDFDWEAVSGERLEPWQFTGSLYGAVPPRVKDALAPIGEWNTFEILYRGDRLAVALNGRTLFDVDTTEVPGRPFSERVPEGFIGLQHHSPESVEGETSVWFKDIYVERL